MKSNTAKLLLLIVITSITSATNATADKPNIILIMADYMGYADTEPYGSQDIKTPAINQLAQQGVRYTNHYAATPICITSRAAFLSGLYPAKATDKYNFGTKTGLPARNNTLLKHFKKQNYKTALIGKWHLGSARNFHPNDHGFDYFYGFDDWTMGYHNHLTSEGKPGLYRNKELIEEDGYLTELFSNEAINFIDQNSQQPFFLFLSYNAGLPPYQGPEHPKEQWNSGWNAEEASRKDYQAMIESMDSGIQKLLAKLDKLALADNTLVIFTYDHGGRHLVNSAPLFHGFATLWEGGIRVPLIMRWPNEIGENKTINQPTIAMDVTASMLEIIQVDTSTEQLDGTNIINTELEGLNDRTLFWQHKNMRAARQGKWKYVVDGHSQLLFDLEEDVSERINQFAQQPQQVKMLKQALSTWEETLKN